ncbi:MAG TPA: biopolymer transporter ExbD [Candidatus Tenderia sp.]|nr:biopolymer transporter ExbD [Candidatus Tenderia sp.]
MNLRQFRREEPSVNLTPLIDVVFLLLIFFMVTTTFREESEIQINLPQASNKPVEHEAQALEVTIDRDGRFFVNQQALINTQLDTLKRALRELKSDADNQSVIVSADANAPHQAVVKAMDAARQVGLTRLSIATRTFERD